MSRRIYLATVALCGLLFPAALASAQDGSNLLPRGPYLSVYGSGTAHAAPDVAFVTLGVTTTGRRAQDATDQNAATTQRVVAAMKDQGVAPKDIQTSNYSLQPLYKNNDAAAGIQGYTVSNTVHATVRKTADAGKVIDAGLSAGANTVQGVSFGLEDRAAAEQEALTEAVREARTKADTMAKAAGVQLGGVLRIEGGAAGPRPLEAGVGGVMFARAATPIEAGELTVTANVTILYRIAGPGVEAAQAAPSGTDAKERAALEDRRIALKVERPGLLARYAPGHPLVRQVDDEIAALDRQATTAEQQSLRTQLAELRAERAKLLLTYSENHPLVVAASRKIAALVARLKDVDRAPK